MKSRYATPLVTGALFVGLIWLASFHNGRAGEWYGGAKAISEAVAVLVVVVILFQWVEHKP